MHRPFRFGVIATAAQSRHTWISTVRRAEELGYATFLVPDSTFMSFAPFTALAIAAEVTTSLHIGSFVFCNDYRHPALLAKEVATLDMLSEGRFELGIGAGREAAVYTQLGLPFDRAGIRISRLEEALHILKRLFTEDTIKFSGKYYTLANIKGIPKPLQKPYPPIYMGGVGKRMLTIAAQEADIVGIIATITDQGIDPLPASLEQKVSWVREAAGERFEQLELSHTAFDIWINDGAVKVLLGGNFPYMLMSTDQAVTYLLEQQAELGFSYIQVTDSQMENFAPVVAELAGK